MNILKLNENDKFYINFFGLGLYGKIHKIDKKYVENIELYLDSIFYALLDAYDIKFEEKYI